MESAADATSSGCRMLDADYSELRYTFTDDASMENRLSPRGQMQAAECVQAG